jgi:ABC-type siderophore export system fused ATPase/permease subunit
LVIEALLLVFTLVAALRDARLRRLDHVAEATATVTRSEKSMSALYSVYGASVASLLVLINNALGVEGNKVILIIVGFLCLTYLFFLSSWFRNSVFFRLVQRIRID